MTSHLTGALAAIIAEPDCCAASKAIARDALNGVSGDDATSPASEAALIEALERMLAAVCCETGFAAAVRVDSGRKYPWPALDLAERAARDALEKS